MTKLEKNALTLAAIAAVSSLMLLSGALVQQAFAHASTTLTLTEDPVAGKKVRVVLGHTNEPTFGAKPGIHDGKHSMEVLLSDSATRLPLTGASLKADMYYFKDFRTFNKAKTLNDATEMQKEVTVGSVFGDPGHYLVREVQNDGIYGYRLYGTISYFGVASVPIDATVFCTSAEGPTTKFNTAGWSGSYGCTEDIDDILFPEKNNDVNPSHGDKASFELGAGDARTQQMGLESEGAQTPLNMVTASSVSSGVQQTSLVLQSSVGPQLLMFGLPAVAASIIGITRFRQRKIDKSL